MLEPAARRASIYTALFQDASDRGLVYSTQAASRAALVDDLVVISRICDEHEASDATLACAAAEGSAGIAYLARLLYAARSYQRAAGFSFSPERKDDQTPAPSQTIVVAGVAEAIEKLNAQGIVMCSAPRRLLLSAAPVGRTLSANGACARMLAATFSDDRQVLMTALTSAPYTIDPLAMLSAFAQAERKASQEDARADSHAPHESASLQSFRKAVPYLSATGAREAAFAALAAFEATCRLVAEQKFSLSAATDILESALCSWALGFEPRWLDAQAPALRAAARAADRIWEAGPKQIPIDARVASLLDEFVEWRLPKITFVPRSSHPKPPAGVEFSDTVGDAVNYASFAESLMLPQLADIFESAQCSTRVKVDLLLATALGEYYSLDVRPAVWLWPRPQEQEPVKAAGMTFSASRLNSYVKCPRRWFYEYLCEALDDSTSQQATYGRVVHAALEALHRDIRVPGKYQAAHLLERLLRELDIAFGKSRPDFATQLEYEVSRRRARRMAEQYVRWLDQEARRAPLEIMHVELMHKIKRGAHQFIGYIDRVDRPLGGGPSTVFDYKTGRIEPDAKSYLEKVRRGDEAQLALYYAMRKDSGDEVGRIALVSIRDPRDDVWILALDIVAEDGTALIGHEPSAGVLRAVCSRADLEASLGALLARCDFLTNEGVSHFAAGEDPPCDYCAYARACRERPMPGERIFAR